MILAPTGIMVDNRQFTVLTSSSATAILLVVGFLTSIAHGQSEGHGSRRNRPAKSTTMPAPLPASDPEPAGSIADLELLQLAGVGASAETLLNLLEKGPAAAIPREVEGGQLAVEAMARLAELKHRPAVPTLSRVATGKMPAGVVALIQRDMTQISPRSRVQAEDNGVKILRINAVTALGWIGDPRGLESIRSAINAEPNTVIRLQMAQSLALLGDSGGMDFVAQVISKGSNRREVAAAASVYKVVTGSDFGISEQTPIRLRKSRATQYARHWASIRETFRPDRDAVIQRRKQVGNVPRYTPRSTADYLKLAADYLDIDDSRGARSAREYLAQAGSSLNAELQRIAADPLEDLDVRMEALNWLFQNQRERAYPFLRSLRRDENPEVADKAQSLLTAPLDPLKTNYVFPK
jgi:hypothetical protein